MLKTQNMWDDRYRDEVDLDYKDDVPLWTTSQAITAPCDVMTDLERVPYKAGSFFRIFNQIKSRHPASCLVNITWNVVLENLGNTLNMCTKNL